MVSSQSTAQAAAKSVSKLDALASASGTYVPRTQTALASASRSQRVEAIKAITQDPESKKHAKRYVEEFLSKEVSEEESADWMIKFQEVAKSLNVNISGNSKLGKYFKQTESTKYRLSHALGYIHESSIADFLGINSQDLEDEEILTALSILAMEETGEEIPLKETAWEPSLKDLRWLKLAGVILD